MALMPEIFVGGQLRINALCLEDYPDLPPNPGSIAHCIASHDQRLTGGRNHQGRKNPKKSCLSAAVRSKQAKQFRGTHVERHAIQGGAIVIAMDEVLYGNDCCRGGTFNLRPGVS